MSKVLQSCEAVVKNAEIKIDLNCSKELANKIYQEVIENKLGYELYVNAPVHPQEKTNRTADWIFVVNSLNFCFWSNKQKSWTITWRGEVYSGYFGLCAAINRAIEEGIDMTDPNVYRNLSFEKFNYIFRGDDEIQLSLMEERYSCIQESGNVLVEKFAGSFVNCIRECNQCAQKLLDLIAFNFIHFRDEMVYNDITVSFYKRAQIIIGDLWSCFEGKELGAFNDIDTVTMFADYRVPQVLCYFGVLQYPDSLLLKLVEGNILEKGCKEEIEIRATSVVAVSKINEFVQELLRKNNKHNKCNCILIDHYLWTYRRNKAKYLDCIPFHKTMTIYY